MRNSASAALLAASICFAFPAAAQPPDGGVAPPRLEPPRIVRFVDADYPEGPLAEGRGAAVELELTISAEGRVNEARVVTPAGEGFDEAAVAAALQFELTPARRDGQPIPARIRYRYVFDPRTRVTEVEEPEPEAEEPPPEQTPAAEDAPPATPPAEAGEAPIEGEATFGATAVVDPPPRGLTRRTLRREVLTRVPGTRGDALRVIELLPGVGRPPFGGGVLLVRGSAPNDSEVFLDSQPIPLLYHFGGLTSFMNSRLLDRIDFYPGSFSVRYGRRIGGIVDVEARDPATDGLHGVADVNLIDASILAEGPIGDRASIAIAARRSYIDFIFDSLVPSGVFDVVAAPVYYDYQALGTWRPTDRDRLRLKIFGSSDEFRLIFSEPPSDNPNIRGNLDLSTQFHRAHVSWTRALSPDVDQELDVSVGPSLFTFGLGESLRIQGDFIQMYGRAEWRARLTRGVRLLFGLDMFLVPFDVAFVGPAPAQTEGSPAMQPLGTRESVALHTTGTAYRPAAYVESELRPVDPLRVVIGLRLDWFRDIEEWAFDPRLTASYDVRPDTRVKAAVGLFSQPPEFQEGAANFGNPNLEPIRAVHVGAGLERDFEGGISASVEGFYKHLTDRIVSTADGAPPRFTNDGEGRIYGVEIAGRVEPARERPYFGFLSYTVSRSERNDRGEGWRLFDFDQTHILTLAASYRLGRGWEVGGTFRLVSGNPYTPLVGGILDVNVGAYAPIAGDVNSERNPLFHRLDVRVEKLWTFELWKLAVYLDVQNVYNATNREGVVYSYDFTRSADLPGLPFLPSIGVRGEL